MTRFVLLPALALSAACHKDQEPIHCFVGDRSLPVEIEPVFRDVAGDLQPMAEGAQVPLILPPQGGKVLFIGVRAKNLDGCPVQLSTSLRDPCTGAVLVVERRPITLEPSPDGWLQPPHRDEVDPLTGEPGYSNLPACPLANIDRDIQGNPYDVTIRVEDPDGRQAEKVVRIVPFCAQPSVIDQCLCECRADYAQGNDCSGERPDSGVSETCDPDAG